MKGCSVIEVLVQISRHHSESLEQGTSSAYNRIGGARVNNKLRVAIVGSTGYGGVELIRFFQNHPQVEITSVISSSSKPGSPSPMGFRI